MSLKMQSAGEMFATSIASSPLWIKLTIGGSLLFYIYIRRQWTALNDCGIDILAPKEWIEPQNCPWIFVREFLSAIFQFLNCRVKIFSNSKQKIWTLGTMGQYFVTGRYAEWAKEELLDKNRRSVAFYRGITPVVLTGNNLRNTLSRCWITSPGPWLLGWARTILRPLQSWSKSYSTNFCFEF